MEEYINMAVEFLTSAVSNLDVYMVAAGALLAALIAIAKLTKTDKDDKVLAKAKAMFDKITSYLPKKKVIK